MKKNVYVHAYITISISISKQWESSAEGEIQIVKEISQIIEGLIEFLLKHDVEDAVLTFGNIKQLVVATTKEVSQIIKFIVPEGILNPLWKGQLHPQQLQVSVHCKSERNRQRRSYAISMRSLEVGKCYLLSMDDRDISRINVCWGAGHT